MGALKKSALAAVLLAALVLPAKAGASVFVQLPGNALAFEPRTVGSESAAQTFVVEVGCDELMNGQVCVKSDTFTPAPVFVGAGSPDFRQTNTCGPSISNPGGTSRATCSFSVFFKPTQPGLRTATLTLGTRKNGPGPPTISVSGLANPKPATRKCAKPKGKKAASSKKKKCGKKGKRKKK